MDEQTMDGGYCDLRARLDYEQTMDEG